MLTGETDSPVEGRRFEPSVPRRIDDAPETARFAFAALPQTKIEKLARLSGRVASKVAGALERQGYNTSVER